jgi:hypothetical protein
MNLPIVYGSDKTEFDLNNILNECTAIKEWLIRYETDKPVVERESQQVNMDLIRKQILLKVQNEELVAAIQEAMLKSKNESLAKAARENPDVFASTKNKAKHGGATSSRSPNSKTEKLCKKLYKKITMKTHPDRVGTNVYLNSLFLAAHRAYEEWDYDGLRAIWKELNDKKGRAEVLAAMQREEASLGVSDRILVAEKRLEELQKKVRKIRQDFFVQVVEKYWENGMEMAIAYHAEGLRQSIAEYSLLNPQLELRLRKARGDYDEFMVDPTIQDPFKE